MIHKAKDLSPDEKLLIEHLLGRRVLEDEAISVRAFEPPALSDERRLEVARQLQQYLSELDANRNAGSPKQADEVITEAVQSVRRGYRPH